MFRWTWLCGLLVYGLCATAQVVDLKAEVAWKAGAPKANHRTKRDVVMWLVSAAPLQAPSPASGLQLIQRNKSFQPHVMVVPVGSVVEFPNRDPFFHNVFSLFEGKRFDLGLYEAGSTRDVRFDKSGVSYIFCNIHSEMSAVVIALQTPFYAISDARGKLTIPHVPEGRYRLHLWYEAALPEELDAMARDIRVSVDSPNLGVLALNVAKRPKTHQNKYGQEYEPPTPGSPAYVKP
jgi:plastocyanin